MFKSKAPPPAPPVAEVPEMASAPQVPKAQAVSAPPPAPPPLEAPKFAIDMAPLLAARTALKAAAAALTQAQEAHDAASALSLHEQKKILELLQKAADGDLADNILFMSDADADDLTAAALAAKKSREQFIKAAVAAALKG